MLEAPERQREAYKLAFVVLCGGDGKGPVISLALQVSNTAIVLGSDADAHHWELTKSRLLAAR